MAAFLGFFNLGSNSITLQVACGLTNKPKDQIVDIDAADAGNDLAAVEYVEDIYKFYKLIEVCDCSSLSVYSPSL